MLALTTACFFLLSRKVRALLEGAAQNPALIQQAMQDPELGPVLRNIVPKMQRLQAHLVGVQGSSSSVGGGLQGGLGRTRSASPSPVPVAGTAQSSEVDDDDDDGGDENEDEVADEEPREPQMTKRRRKGAEGGGKKRKKKRRRRKAGAHADL
jgi:hypothetical protein